MAFSFRSSERRFF